MNESEFDRLLESYKKDQLTDGEKESVDAWFHNLDTGAAMPLSDTAKARVKSNILATISMPAHRAAGHTETFTIGPAHTISRARNWKWLKIAASILVLVFAGVWAWQFQYNSAKPQTYASNGTVRKVALPDGSLVWLKGTSEIEFPSTFASNTRNVTLHGEALFEVAKDAQHPFVIQCDQVTTTVLGTSFNLKSAGNGVELTVLTGKVSLTSPADANGTVVLPNERAIYNSEKLLISKQTIAPEEKKAATDGTAYEMNFNDVAMSEVISRIEHKFDVTVLVSNQNLRNCKIHANFSDQSLDNTLNMVSQALGIQYRIRHKTVELTGNGCN